MELRISGRFQHFQNVFSENVMQKQFVINIECPNISDVIILTLKGCKLVKYISFGVIILECKFRNVAKVIDISRSIILN